MLWLCVDEALESSSRFWKTRFLPRDSSSSSTSSFETPPLPLFNLIRLTKQQAEVPIPYRNDSNAIIVMILIFDSDTLSFFILQ